jgi:hypothetical protein
MRLHQLCVVVLASSVCSSQASAQVVIDYDTTVDYTIDDGVAIREGANPTPPTVVSFVEPADIRMDIDVYDASEVHVLGGEFRDALATRDTSTLRIFGGHFWEGLAALDASTMHVFGGQDVDDVSLDAGGSSTITVYGTDFNYPYGPIGDASGRLTGTLLNGDKMWEGGWPFEIHDQAQIILAIPEPSTLVLLTTSALGMLAFIRRRH